MSPTPIRTVFMGTAGIAVPMIRSLHAAPHIELLAVVSQPDRPKGRKMKLLPTETRAGADSLGLPVLQPDRCRQPEFLAEIRALRPEAIVVMAYGQILPSALLAIPTHGCLNLHTSLLPKYRGAAPIQWALWNGDPETGVTIIRMDEGMDTGDILASETTSIEPGDDAVSIHDRLAEMGARLMPKTLADWVTDRIRPTAQDHGLATHARKIGKDDGRLDWSRSATELWHQVRALKPWPGTYCQWESDGRPGILKVWRAEPADGPNVSPGQVLKSDRAGIEVVCGSGALRLLEVQKEGGKRLAARDFVAGNSLPVGTRLG